MKYVAIIGAILVLIALMFVSPLLTIASLNTLFGLNIAYTVWTYMSVMWLNLVTFGGLGLSIRRLKKG
jgi:hypothetical protein